MSSTAATVLIGVGNRDRGDDAVGPIVCDRVDELGLAGLRTVVLESAVVDLSTYWGSDDRVIIVDAAQPDDQPGRIIEYDTAAGRFAVPASMSTHSIDVTGAVELARVMDQMPAELVVLAIEGESFEFGAPLSGLVEASVGEVVNRFR